MMFLSKWIVIVFEFGGIGYAAYILLKIRRTKAERATIDLKALRNAICLLFPFIIFTTFGLTDILIQYFGGPTYPSTLVFGLNLLIGLFFIGFLVGLKRAIIFEREDKAESE